MPQDASLGAAVPGAAHEPGRRPVRRRDQADVRDLEGRRRSDPSRRSPTPTSTPTRSRTRRSTSRPSWATDTDQSDRTMARAAVVEGDATLLMSLWAQQHLTPAELGEVGRRVDPASEAVLARMPAILKDPLLFPYTQRPPARAGRVHERRLRGRGRAVRQPARLHRAGPPPGEARRARGAGRGRVPGRPRRRGWATAGRSRSRTRSARCCWGSCSRDGGAAATERRRGRLGRRPRVAAASRRAPGDGEVGASCSTRRLGHRHGATPARVRPASPTRPHRAGRRSSSRALGRSPRRESSDSPIAPRRLRRWSRGVDAPSRPESTIGPPRAGSPNARVARLTAGAPVA